MILLLIKYYSGDQLEKNEIGGHVALWRRGEVRTGFRLEDVRERDPGVDGRIILRRIFRKWDGGHELD